MVLLESHRIGSKDFSSDNKFKRFILFGPINCGTHLLQRILLDLNAQEFQMGVWKHSWNWDVSHVGKRPGKREGVCRILIVKHPVYWLSSWKKRSYHTRLTDGINGLQEFSNKGVDWSFDSAIDMWKTTVQFYKADAFFSPENTYYVMYFDLLHRPEKVVDGLKKIFRTCSFSSSSGIVYQQSKNHGLCRSRNECLEFYTIKNLKRLSDLSDVRLELEKGPLEKIWGDDTYEMDVVPEGFKNESDCLIYAISTSDLPNYTREHLIGLVESKFGQVVAPTR